MKKINANKNASLNYIPDKYTFNEIIIEHNEKNIFIDLDKKIKQLKENWRDKEAFYAILRDIDKEILGGTSFEPEEQEQEHKLNFYKYNLNSTNNACSPDVSLISNENNKLNNFNYSNLKK